jgi:starvation-inducible DNA-binding protein
LTADLRPKFLRQSHFDCAAEIQASGTVNHLLSLELEESMRLEVTAQLNQLLTDRMTLRDLHKKSDRQVAGPSFYQLHLLFDKPFDEQVELVEAIGEVCAAVPFGSCG